MIALVCPVSADDAHIRTVKFPWDMPFLLHESRNTVERIGTGMCGGNEVWVQAYRPIREGFLWLLSPGGTPSRNCFLPAAVDTSANWKRGDFLRGNPDTLHELERGGWLLTSQTAPDGAEVLLFHSENLLDWRSLPLPTFPVPNNLSLSPGSICEDTRWIFLTMGGFPLDPHRVEWERSWRTLIAALLQGAPEWVETEKVTATRCSDYKTIHSLNEKGARLYRETEDVSDSDLSYTIELEGRPVRVVFPPGSFGSHPDGPYTDE